MALHHEVTIRLAPPQIYGDPMRFAGRGNFPLALLCARHEFFPNIT